MEDVQVDDDIDIMMSVCLSVTKNHHFLLGVSCNHPGWFFMVLGRFLWFFMVLGQVFLFFKVPGCFFMVPGGFLMHFAYLRQMGPPPPSFFLGDLFQFQVLLQPFYIPDPGSSSRDILQSLSSTCHFSLYFLVRQRLHDFVKYMKAVKKTTF